MGFVLIEVRREPTETAASEWGTLESDIVMVNVISKSPHNLLSQLYQLYPLPLQSSQWTVPAPPLSWL